MNKIITLLILMISFGLMSCGGDKKTADNTAQKPSVSGLTAFEEENGIGPIKEKMTLGEIDPAKVKAGEATFKSKCAPCHRLDKRLVGPAQRYVADRRSPEYIMNMILNPDEMVKKEPMAKKLLAEYLSPMTNMHLTIDQAREVLEYFRAISKEGHEKNIPAVPVFRSSKK